MNNFRLLFIVAAFLLFLISAYINRGSLGEFLKDIAFALLTATLFLV